MLNERYQTIMFWTMFVYKLWNEYQSDPKYVECNWIDVDDNNIHNTLFEPNDSQKQYQNTII